ncbi:MAG: small GTP-binding protein [Planctomycetota bacterium]|jgi:small GTP-binding protein
MANAQGGKFLSAYDELIHCESDLDALEDRLGERDAARFQPLNLPQRSEGVPPNILTIGLVGGTGVGKSTIVNALAGRDISATSVRRPTTSRVIPYVHQDRTGILSHLEFLSGHLSETVASHDIEALKSLVILDLPDIDSTRVEHAEVVSAALSGLDLVIWVTSLTKYSDREFHEWIKRHGASRNLDNAIFVLNKVDAIQEKDVETSAKRLKQNFEKAINESLHEGSNPIGTPRFFTCSATNPRVPLPGNEFVPFFDEIARERSQQEIERIKSSDRIALLKTRLEHIGKTISFSARQEELRQEVSIIEGKLKELISQKEVRVEILKRLESSSAPEKAGAKLFDDSLSKWPILPHLRILSIPLRQAGRLLTGARLLIPNEENETKKNRPFPRLMDGMFEIEKERRQIASRAPKTLVDRDRDAEHAAIDRRLIELENECVLRVRDGLSAMVESNTDSTAKPSLIRRLLVWAPLLWFPLIQPLMEEILRPTSNVGTLPGRMAFRLVRMFGATHLMISIVFVLIIYMIYVLVLRARAHLLAVSQCRELLESKWWRESLLERLTAHLAAAEHHELERLQEEEAEWRSISKRIEHLDESLEARS